MCMCMCVYVACQGSCVSPRPPLQQHKQVGVHIADVSYFVREGTPLDAEAARRATTVRDACGEIESHQCPPDCHSKPPIFFFLLNAQVYLVQKVVPMLPPLLCEQLCRWVRASGRLGVWACAVSFHIPSPPPPFRH